MSKERIKQVKNELDLIIQKLIDSPKIFDLYICSGGDEVKGYYFVLNCHPRVSQHAMGTKKHYEEKPKEFYHD